MIPVRKVSLRAIAFTVSFAKRAAVKRIVPLGLALGLASLLPLVVSLPQAESQQTTPRRSLLQELDKSLPKPRGRSGPLRVRTGVTLTPLVDFRGSNGGFPYGNLTFGRNRNTLFGMTATGGANRGGTLFKVSTTGTGFKTLVNFDGSNGSNPRGSLILGPNSNNLYGMAPEGGLTYSGTLFKVSTTGTGFQTLVNFDGNTGTLPLGSLILGKDGNNLYGMTNSAGAGGFGTLFKVSRTGTGFQTLVNFNGSNGSNPSGSLILGKDGNNLYGMTFSGGSSDKGTLFKVSRTGTGFQTLVNFNGSNGRSPIGSLTLAPDGTLYGMTSAGGSSDKGTVFKVSRTGRGFQTLVNFNGSNGAEPWGSLTLAPDGNFYGMTASGGANDGGTVFVLNPTTKQLTTLVDFSPISGNSGYSPRGDLLLGSSASGTLTFYFMTYAGGSGGKGTVFSLTVPAS